MASGSLTSSHNNNFSNILSTWTAKQDKLFENALAVHGDTNPNCWEMIAKAVGGKTVPEVKQHYQLLVHDIQLIETGLLPLPNYRDNGKGLLITRDPEDRIKNLKV